MKKILFFTAMLFVAMQATASDIDATTARSVAMRFLSQMASTGRRAAPAAHSDIHLVYTEQNPSVASQAAYYIFNTCDSYVIVAGDDRAEEVLAHGDAPIDMNNLPSAMRYWLNCYKQEMEYLQAHPELEVTSARHKAAPRPSASVQPLLTALWSQEYPYYNQCPTSNGARCVTGCAATSLSMVFYYWKYPTAPTPSIPAYRTSTLNMYIDELPPTTFDWDNMLDTYRGNFSSQQSNAMAWLMRYVGQTEEMDYTPSSSGTYGWNIMHAVQLFGYDSDARYVYKDNYTDEEWAELLQTELQSSRPIEFCAYGGMSGHAFNVDGYDAVNDQYHINWGWGGQANGYFSLNAFRGGGTTYKSGQQMVIGLEPPATKPTIRADRRRLALVTYVDRATTARFTVKGKLLNNGVTLTLNDPTGAYSLNVNQISKSDLNWGKQVVVTFKPDHAADFQDASITLSSEGADDLTIYLDGTGVLETYDPVMTVAENADGSSINVQWQDKTPTHNVKNYRIEVGPVPFHETRLMQSFEEEYNGNSNTDWSTRMDEITGTAGWSGYKVYRGNGYITLGSATKKGWIQTPAIDMRGNNGVMTVKVTAMSTSSETTVPLKVSCGTSDTTILVTNKNAQHSLLLPCPASTAATVRLENSIPGKRVLLSKLEVMAGDDYSPISSDEMSIVEGISSPSYLLDNVSPGFYALRVQAVYTDGSVSQWSNRLFVQLDWARGDVNHDCEVNIADVNTLIDVITVQTHEVATSASDINGDGEVNIADINALIDMILNQ